MAHTVALGLHQTATSSSYFGTTKLNRKPKFGDDHSAHDASYEGGDFFEVTDRNGMVQFTAYNVDSHSVQDVIGAGLTAYRDRFYSAL